jgi:hypothetical protein
MSDNTYIPLDPHVPPEAVKVYLEQMSPKERDLHNLAIELLGSSYFVEYSHGYLNWVKPQNS